jgi:hypothetical protein
MLASRNAVTTAGPRWATRMRWARSLRLTRSQIKSAIGNRGTFGLNEKRIDYSRRPNPLTPQEVSEVTDRLRYGLIRDQIANALSRTKKYTGIDEEIAKKKSSKFYENFIDHALPLGDMVDMVREKKGSIPDMFDAYLAQQLWSSKATDHLKRLERSLYSPIYRAIRGLQVSDADVADFKKRFPSPGQSHRRVRGQPERHAVGPALRPSRARAKPRNQFYERGPDAKRIRRAHRGGQRRREMVREPDGLGTSIARPRCSSARLSMRRTTSA